MLCSMHGNLLVLNIDTNSVYFSIYIMPKKLGFLNRYSSLFILTGFPYNCFQIVHCLFAEKPQFKVVYITIKLMSYSPQLLATLTLFKGNNAPSIVLIRANRGQHWQGKQNKNSEERRLSKEQCLQIFYYSKIFKVFGYLKKITSYGSLSYLMQWNWCNKVYTFSEVPSTENAN